MRPPNLPMTGFPSRTLSIECDDTVQIINPAELISDNNQPVIAMLISAETNAIRFTFGDAIPDQATQTGHIIVANGYQFLRIENPYAIRTFSFMNAVTQANGILHVTLEFDKSLT